ncbi:SPOR domain-containing protein [bacterium]|nr:SPOR domain-containing protein [bacterium]
MKCLISVMAISLICSFAYAMDESSLPGATIIELEEINTVVETPVVEQQPAQSIQQVVEEAIQSENIHTAATLLKCDNKNAVYTVQLGAFKARERAFALYWQLSKKVTPLQVTAPLPKDKLYRVRYGSYPNQEEAQVAAEKLRKKGIECFVTTLKTMEIIPLKMENE